MTDNTYRVALGPPLQGKILTGDRYWQTFNGAFQNVQLASDLIAAELYEGRPITTWCDPQWRKSENYKLGQHLGLDFDTEDKHSTLQALLKEPFISKYAAFLYTTPSHTPDKPRARVIFLLDTPIYQAANYTLAASALLWIFGTADRQCKDPVRFFYGGKPGACELEWLGNELPLELMKDLINRYKTTGNAERKKPRTYNYEGGTVNERKIADALQHINPWSLDYDQWLYVLMGIHHALGNAGLDLAEQWADGKPHEVESKWHGFGGNATGLITEGTLFKIAKENGWRPVN